MAPPLEQPCNHELPVGAYGSGGAEEWRYGGWVGINREMMFGNSVGSLGDEIKPIF